MSSAVQVVQVCLMLVGLFLKTDMEIGLCGIPVFHIQDEPLYAIPDEERDIEKFLLLGSMNRLVVHLNLTQGSDGKDKAKQADGVIILPQGQAFENINALRLHLFLLYQIIRLQMYANIVGIQNENPTKKWNAPFFLFYPCDKIQCKGCNIQRYREVVCV